MIHTKVCALNPSPKLPSLSENSRSLFLISTSYSVFPWSTGSTLVGSRGILPAKSLGKGRECHAEGRRDTAASHSQYLSPLESLLSGREEEISVSTSLVIYQVRLRTNSRPAWIGFYLVSVQSDFTSQNICTIRKCISWLLNYFLTQIMWA